MEATEVVAFQEETLRGDVRDKFLDDVIRRMPGWGKLSEREQSTTIDRVATVASQIVREAVRLVGHRGFEHSVVSLGKWTVKEGIKLEATGPDTVEEITKLAQHKGTAILVFASPTLFLGERAAAEAEKDQPDLPIDAAAEDEEGDGGDLPDADLPDPPDADSLAGTTLDLSQSGLSAERRGEIQKEVERRGGKVGRVGGGRRLDTHA